MTILDFIVLGIMLICVIFYAAKGLLMSLYNLLALLVSIFLARELYPFVSDFLRQTVLFEALKRVTVGWMGPVADNAGQTFREAVDGLALPAVVRGWILEGGADTWAADISAFHANVSEFLAGLAINAISILMVFVLVFVLTRLLGLLLRIVARLPIISTFNRLGGALLGLVAGAALSWLLLFVLNGLFSANPDFPVAQLLEDSVIAHFFAFTE